ncbi:MAG: dependent oxidoreductase [Proteobacteria bacterium]|nr:dependent oxidoreductase [Pseudomonadota bacterium]
MDTVIIGNGILALTIAFRLSRAAGEKDTISIIGKRERTGSATLAAGAMLNSFAEIEADSLDNELDLYRFELSHLATKMWPKFEQELITAAGSCLPSGCRNCQGFQGGGCVDCGTYIVNNTAADDLDDENFDAILNALREFNEPHELISPRDIPNYLPDQRYRATRALYIFNEGWFNPRLMIEKLEAILANSPQVNFINTNVAKLLKENETVSAVELEDGSAIAGENFILAAGAAVSDLVNNSALGIDIQRIFYGVGVSVEIRSPDFPHKKCIRTPNRGLACGIYSVPYITADCNDHILLGASNFISPTPYPYGRITSVESLLKAGMEQINRNFYRADLVRVNVGWRPTSQDTYPMIGRTSIQNLIIVSATKRDGFHMSPLISEYVVAMLNGQPVDKRFDVFAPERSPIRPLTREQAINKAVRHQTSAAYQHGFSPSKSRMPEQVGKMFRDELERLHDQVGAYDWGIPPEMLDMYRYGHAKP